MTFLAFLSEIWSDIGQKLRFSAPPTFLTYNVRHSVAF